MTPAPLPETCRATVWIRPGRAAYRGPSLRLDPHSGSVDCLAVGLDEPFTLHTAAGARRARDALIPARTRHRIVTGGRVVFCYLEPNAGTDAGDLARRLRDGADPGQVLAEPAVPARTDERIRAALELMRANPGDRLAAADVARAVHLSTSRFLHLFSAHTGTSFRRYRLWTRMVRVAAGVGVGNDLTRASADAGFASPAHFSDSFHAMFGLTAARLLSGDVRVVVAGNALRRTGSPAEDFWHV